jgi:peptidyl-dipeptidase Dcp
MKGVPQDVKDAAAAAAKERKLPAGTYAVVNTRSAVDPILTFGDNRALREKIWRAFVNRGDNGGANDTNATIAKVVKLRADRAKLLGFESHAEFRMQDTMAKTPAKAMDLMNRVWPAAVGRVKEEVRDQQALAKKLGQNVGGPIALSGGQRSPNITIEPWDYRYYQEKVRKERYNLTQEEVKPYFELNNIINASYGRRVSCTGSTSRKSPERCRPGTRHPRLQRHNRADGKQSECSTRRLCPHRQALRRLGDDLPQPRRPSRRRLVSARTTTISSSRRRAAGADQPRRCETLFHEFGHAIHLLPVGRLLPSFGGTPRDFVEYPSQVNENWLLTPAGAQRFAKHYKTASRCRPR